MAAARADDARHASAADRRAAAADRRAAAADRRAAAADRRAHIVAARGHDHAPRRLLRRLVAPRLQTIHAPVHGAVTIRYAFPDDEAGLARLAVLDSAAAASPPLLVAEVDGELRAALSLADGAVIADPFRPAAALLDLLATRAAQLVAAEQAHGERRSAPPSWRVRVVPEDGPQDVRPA
jgi:hypothetical protein